MRRPTLTPRLLLAGGAVAVLAVPFALVLALVLERWGPLHRLDVRTAARLNVAAAGDPALVRAMRVLSDVFHPDVFRVAAVLVAVLLAARGLRRSAVYAALTVLLGGLLDTLVKVLVDRPRPVLPHPVAHAGGASFPSGHAFGVVVGVGVLLVVGLPLVRAGWRPWAVLVGALVVGAVGWARIGLGVHYVSDVVGGYLLGLAWWAALTAAFHDPGPVAAGPSAGDGAGAG